ncbi:hypothetical protein BH10ACT3_BH10ACT3_00280 [soil metagenome]
MPRAPKPSPLADPRHWGIQGVGRFDERGTPRATAASIGQPELSDEIIAAYPLLTKLELGKRYQGGYWETRVPVPEARWWSSSSGWHEGAQEAFDNIWPSELDSAVDDLILEYGSGWHNAFQVTAVTRHPEFCKSIVDATESGILRLNNMYRGNVGVTLDLALSEGPWRKTLDRRSWPFPNPQTCQVCGASHYFDTVRYYHVRRYGRPGVCARCLDLALWGYEFDHRSKISLEEGLVALRSLSAETGVVPATNFRESITTAGLDDGKRQKIVAALVSCPTAASLRAAADDAPWIAILKRAEVVGDAWRPARGVMCLAEDGHPCRSLGERAIDDWLHRNGVSHEVEPSWPIHAEHNPNGRLRADWRVGEHLIEYAGMMTDKEYAGKIASKRKLAAATATSLLILLPEDLYHLDDLLGAYFAQR